MGFVRINRFDTKFTAFNLGDDYMYVLQVTLKYTLCISTSYYDIVVCIIINVCNLRFSTFPQVL